MFFAFSVDLAKMPKTFFPLVTDFLKMLSGECLFLNVEQGLKAPEEMR